MSTMYVANATKQVQTFMYRLPETKQPRQQTIDVGQQVRLSGDLSHKDIQAIIRQHAKYGMVAVSEIKDSKGLIPLCFQLDTPIAPEVIEMLVNINTGVLDDRGRVARENSAIVAATTIGQNLRERGEGTEFSELHVDLIEDDDQRSRSRRGITGEERREEKVIVSRTDRAPPKGANKSKRK